MPLNNRNEEMIIIGRLNLLKQFKQYNVCMSLDMKRLLIKNNIPNKRLTVIIQYYTGESDMGDEDVLVSNERLLYNKYIDIDVNCIFILW